MGDRRLGAAAAATGGLDYLELAFLTFSIRVLFAFKAIGFLSSLIFSKEVKLEEPKYADALKKVSWPILPAMIIFGVLSGIVIYISTKGYGIVSCVTRDIAERPLGFD